LVLFVILAFALLGIAALVLDLGFAVLTTRQMRTAVDAAALEGLRGGDLPELIPTSDTPDEELIGPAGRRSASRLVRLIFDDDLTPENGDPRHYGAGPVLTLGPGVGDANALQLLHIPPQRSYKPILRLNPPNHQAGDMVNGTYRFEQPHTEDANYNRPDFLVDEGGNDFLVRLRRTNNFRGLDEIPQVSSRGPPMPYLFGRGALMAGGNPARGYSPRFHGITVRQTAIASTRRVAAVGAPGESVIGAAPFELQEAFWNQDWDGNAETSEEQVQVRIVFSNEEDDGTDENDGFSVGTILFDRSPVGHFIVSPTTLSLGQQPAETGLPDDFTTVDGYVPIVGTVLGQDEFASSRELIVGFGRVTLEASDTSGPVRSFTLTRHPGGLTTENVTAVVLHPLPGDVDVRDLFRRFFSLRESLLAAVLVR
jgi:hypothetical protein